MTSSRLDRRGMHILGAVLGSALVALLLGLVQGRRVTDMVRWSHRLHGERTLEDLLAGACEEATSEVMADANRPGTPLFTALRNPGALHITPRLEATRRLWNEARVGRDLKVEVSLIERTPLSSAFPEHIEGHALLVVDARARAEWPGSPVMTVRQVRPVRQALVTLPPPMDAIVRYVPGDPANDGAVLPADLNLDHWRVAAALVVGPDGDVNRRFAALVDRLDVVNGVMFVDVPAGQTLRLEGRRWKGKALLVVRGAVSLEDVRPDDPTRDLLTVMAFGDVTLSGTLEMALVLTHATDGPPVVRRTRGTTRVVGAFILTEGRLDATDPIELIPEPTRHRAGGPTGRLTPDRVQVAVSPVLLQKGVFVQ